MVESDYGVGLFGERIEIGLFVFASFVFHGHCYGVFCDLRVIRQLLFLGFRACLNQLSAKMFLFVYFQCNRINNYIVILDNRYLNLAVNFNGKA